jgi:hypothetical protein
MLTGIVLLYVGAALLINGIWLIGQARVADRQAIEPTPEMAGEPLQREPLISAGQVRRPSRSNDPYRHAYLNEKVTSVFCKDAK